jgi:hypothetical protein
MNSGALKVIAVGAVFVLFAAFLAFLWPNQRVQLSFETISQGIGHLRCEKHLYLIADNFDEWVKIWLSVGQGSTRPPQIDFQTYAVIALFMGERSTGGYSISVERIVDSDTEIVVEVRETYPGRIYVTQAFTWPHHIIKVVRRQKPMVFELSQFLAHSHDRDGKPYGNIVYELVGKYRVGSGCALPEPRV